MTSNNAFLKEIFDRPYRALESRVLKNAIQLKLFEDLKLPISADQLAQKRNWHAGNCEILLQTLVALGYLERADGLYKNGENSEKYLLQESPYYIGTFVMMFDSYIASTFPEDVTELLKNGPKAPDQSQNANVDFSQMVNALRAYQTGYPQAQFRALLNRYDEYKNAKKILDLGCGTAMIGLSFAEDNDTAEIVLYDMPTMAGAIEESIQMVNVKNKTTIKSGDFTKDDIGAGYDVIFSANSIYGAKANLDDTVQKLYNSLNDGGIFMCISDGVAKDFSAPWDMVLSWMPYRMNNMDMSMPKDAVYDAALKVGFKSVAKDSMHLIGGRVDVDVFKK